KEDHFVTRVNVIDVISLVPIWVTRLGNVVTKFQRITGKNLLVQCIITKIESPPNRERPGQSVAPTRLVVANAFKP
ncbi:MAG TPA: hypothetical protein PL064_12875, partial [Thermogutta sp.]|nr:hypothetical protein [Thermogutta sp.]